MHVTTGVRRASIQLAVRSVGEPVGVVSVPGLLLAEQNLELPGVKIAVNRVENRLIGWVPISQSEVMIIKILVIDHLTNRLDEIRILETGIKAGIPPNHKTVTVGGEIVGAHRNGRLNYLIAGA